jgi:RNA recognition motif-containing protein
MKSPQVTTVGIIALVLAVVGYIVASIFGLEAAAVAVSLFIGAMVAPFIGTMKGASSPTTEEIKTLYVGNLAYRANEASVRSLFSEFGTVHSVRLMKDKHTGKRRGFGFVEMSAVNLETAISALNETEFQQRTLKVREAKDRPERVEDNNNNNNEEEE